jgi:hypothetical protein
LKGIFAIKLQLAFLLRRANLDEYSSL